ncbi:hypothetical protein [Brevibacillus sp. DP1.3A]|uniref:hypothetical protein n=1 Tax=Brevibacillus sp. DP1.3A TaxID=2738867 RepID=UPI00156A7B20|nr:hypothetical protein [Brevibacillus sp. DP1.3A]UED76469.1 hypothetical protein HP399_008245 [Brevibacillus sp. DP1.3A]
MIYFKESRPYFLIEDSILPFRAELYFEIFNCFLDKDEFLLFAGPVKTTDREYMKFIEERKVLIGSIDTWFWWPKLTREILWFKPKNNLEILNEIKVFCACIVTESGNENINNYSFAMTLEETDEGICLYISEKARGSFLSEVFPKMEKVMKDNKVSYESLI